MENYFNPPPSRRFRDGWIYAILETVVSGIVMILALVAWLVVCALSC